LTAALVNLVYGPPDTVELYTRYPATVVVLGIHDSVVLWEITCTPDADRATVPGEFVALLAIAIEPVMLPAAVGRFWARDTTLMIAIATASGAASGYAGLLISFHTGVASGPAIILVAGGLYLTSLLFGRVGGLVRQAFPGRHLEA